MTLSRRRLPHWRPDGKRLFVTWHLYGSLPHNRFPPAGTLTAGKAFVWMDRYLDEARSGPVWLKREEIARIVVSTRQYSYVVMPNHVHAVLLPLVSPAKLMQSVKGFSAREANRVLGRSGEPFCSPSPTTTGSGTTWNLKKCGGTSKKTPSGQGWLRQPKNIRGPARSSGPECWKDCSTSRAARLLWSGPPACHAGVPAGIHG